MTIFLILFLMSSEPVDKEEYLPEELNEMEFKDALFNDHRSFFQYYFSILSEKQIILSTILNKSIFYQLSLRLILLFFTMASFFFLNALFFTEDFISDRYNSTEQLNIWYILKNELSKSVYASLIGKIVALVTSSTADYIKIKKMERKMDCLIELAHLMEDMKRKYLIVLVIISILSLFYWYFLFVFCSIYRNNQISWIQSSLISIFINVIIPIVLCFIISAIRILSFKCNNRFLFKVGYCIYQII